MLFPSDLEATKGYVLGMFKSEGHLPAEFPLKCLHIDKGPNLFRGQEWTIEAIYDVTLPEDQRPDGVYNETGWFHILGKDFRPCRFKVKFLEDGKTVMTMHVPLESEDASSKATSSLTQGTYTTQGTQ